MKPITLLRQARTAGLSRKHRRAMMQTLDYGQLATLPEDLEIQFPGWAWRMLSWDLPGAVGDYMEAEKQW